MIVSQAGEPIVETRKTFHLLSPDYSCNLLYDTVCIIQQLTRYKNLPGAYPHGNKLSSIQIAIYYRKVSL